MELVTRTVRTVLAFVLFWGCTKSEPVKPTPPEVRLSEASMNFDLEDLEPFLLRVAAKLDGFSKDDVARVAGDVSKMKVDEQRDWEFMVSTDARGAPQSASVPG